MRRWLRVFGGRLVVIVHLDPLLSQLRNFFCEHSTDIWCNIVYRQTITSCRYRHWTCCLWSYLCTHNDFVIKWGCTNGLYLEVLAGDVEDDTIVDLRNSAFVSELLPPIDFVHALPDEQHVR